MVGRIAALNMYPIYHGLERAAELLKLSTLEPLAEAPAWLAADANRERGEFVLLVSAPPPRTSPNSKTCWRR